MSEEKYVKSAVENVEHNLSEYNQFLPIRCKTPLMSGYWTETETPPKLKTEGVTHYQDMVGVIRWSVDLGRVYIILETALMSKYLSFPCRGHIKQVFYLFSYLKVNSKRNLLFDPQHLTIYEHLFAVHDWYDFYRYDKEAIPADVPTPSVNVVSTHFLWTLLILATGRPGDPRPGSEYF